MLSGWTASEQPCCLQLWR